MKHRIVIIGSLFIVLTGSCGKYGGPPPSSWKSEARGRIVFVACPTDVGLPPTLCVVEVPSLNVTLKEVPDKFQPDGYLGAKWTNDGQGIVYGSDKTRGLLRREGRTGECRLISRWRSDLSTEFTEPIIDSGSVRYIKYVDVPGQLWFDYHVCVGRQSGKLYSIREDNGLEPPVHVMVLDSLAGDSILFPYEGTFRGLAVSPDEKLLAFSDDKDIRLHSRQGGEWRSLSHPSDFPRLFEPAFSPDGQFLAAVGWGSPNKGPTGVAISRAPDFSSFVTLAKTLYLVPWSLCWSPDGKWILLSTIRFREPYRLIGHDLVVVEVKSGKWFVLPDLRVDTRRGTKTVCSEGYVDWTD